MSTIIYEMKNKSLILTSYFAGTCDSCGQAKDKNLQITMDKKYIQLDKYEVVSLIKAMQIWVDNYSARATEISY